MEQAIYQQMKQIENEHWWFKARQDIILTILQRWGRLEEGMHLLDLGCGTGHFLQALSPYPVIAEGRDFSSEALKICTSRGLRAEKGCLPYEINVKEKVDTVLMLDVLEHIEDDWETLNELHHLIHEGGRVLLTVPAHPWMWSKHDESHHHFRRYTKQNLLELFQQTGWKVEFLSPYNSLLFPLATLVRFTKKVVRKEGDENQIPNPFINQCLWRIFQSEKKLLAKHFSLPFGLSYLAYLKPKQHPKWIGITRNYFRSIVYI